MARRGDEIVETVAQLQPTEERPSFRSAKPARQYVSREEAVAYWASGRQPEEAATFMKEYSEDVGGVKRYFLPTPPSA